MVIPEQTVCLDSGAGEALEAETGVSGRIVGYSEVVAGRRRRARGAAPGNQLLIGLKPL